jgi:hypothetical protein
MVFNALPARTNALSASIPIATGSGETGKNGAKGRRPLRVFAAKAGASSSHDSAACVCASPRGTAGNGNTGPGADDAAGSRPSPNATPSASHQS